MPGSRHWCWIAWRCAQRASKASSSLESERLSNALLNSISHELRTPLAAITSATSALAEIKNDGMQS
jgi:two-component system sensor histidine kinase KdpD